MADPAIKLFGKTIPLPELGVVVDSSCSSYTGVSLTDNPVRLSDSCTGDDDEEMGDSGLGEGGGESESDKKVTFCFFGFVNLSLFVDFDDYP